MCRMNRNESITLALLSLAAIMFAGSYFLGDKSWFLWLLVVPGALIASIDRSDGPEPRPASRRRSRQSSIE
jgi:hypothetical protein